jgi:hypothetical protein
MIVCHYFALLIQYHLGGEIKENKVGGERGIYGGEEKCMQSFCGERWKDNIKVDLQ